MQAFLDVMNKAGVLLTSPVVSALTGFVVGFILGLML